MSDLNISPTPRSLDGAYPHVTVGAVLIDNRNRTLILHRSSKVRSAKNCWSVPTGLLDHGESIDAAIVREVREELCLNVTSIGEATTVGENQPGDGFHWVLLYRIAHVEDVTSFTNVEPEKHDVVFTTPVNKFLRTLRDESLSFSPGLAAPVRKLLSEYLE